MAGSIFERSLAYNGAMLDETTLREQLVRVCRQLYAKELIVATDGNVSARLGADRFLTTPSGVCKGYLEPDMLVVVDAEGQKVDGMLKPSSEFGMHLAIYRVRPDAEAIVHAHPPTATAFSVAGVSLEPPILTEVVITLGAIPTTPYATPGTPEVGDAVRGAAATHDAFILDHHGAVTLGRSLDEAYYRMETVEQTAKVHLMAHQLGGIRPLAPVQVEALDEIRRKLLSAKPDK
ncbi:L-fuculose phosphate aldolase [compost metagenome]